MDGNNTATKEFIEAANKSDGGGGAEFKELIETEKRQ